MRGSWFLSLTVARVVSLMLAATILLAATCDEAEEDLPQGQVTASTAQFETLSPDSPIVAGTPGPTPEGWTSFRWGNLTAARPPLESGVEVWPDHYSEIDKDPILAIMIFASNRESLIAVDATTGSVIHSSVTEKDKADLDNVLRMLRFEEPRPQFLPWPYSGEPDEDALVAGGTVNYFEPEPMSGFKVEFQVGEPGPDTVAGECLQALTLSNGRSTVNVDACTGAKGEDTSNISPGDEEAVANWLSRLSVASTSPGQ